MRHMTHIPLWAKLILTVYVAVLLPIYWVTYGPTNFLLFCDMALLLTLLAMWRESALLVSAAAVGILLPQLLWALDFLSSLVGHPVTGMTEYMFQSSIPLHVRFLSFFHFWLPFLQSSRFGTKKKWKSIQRLSMIGNSGVVSLAKAVTLTLKVSPGSTSSR